MNVNPLRGAAVLLTIGAIASMLCAHAGLASATNAPKTSTPNWIRPPGLDVGCDGPISALAVLPDDRLVLGGRFRNCGGVAAANVALWDPQLGMFLPLGAGVSGSAFGTAAVITAIAADADQIVVGGAFTTAGGSVATNLARYRFASLTWESLGAAGNEGVNAEVTALARRGDTLFVGGAFDRAGGVVARHLARFDITTGSWSALPGPPPATIVRALAATDNALYVGGDARLLQQTPTSPILSFDLGTSLWSTVATFDGRVNAIAAVGTELYVGGRFSSGGTPLGRIARIDLDTQVTTALGTVVGGTFFGTAVTALAATTQDVFVVGDFSFVGDGNTAGGANIARFNRASARWANIGRDYRGIDSPGLATSVANGLGYVGGGFSTAGFQPSRGVAAFTTPELLFQDGFELPAP